jgi:hypothetical protein
VKYTVGDLIIFNGKDIIVIKHSDEILKEFGFAFGKLDNILNILNSDKIDKKELDKIEKETNTVKNKISLILVKLGYASSN